MLDLNKRMGSVHDKGKKLEQHTINLLRDYEDLCRESLRSFRNERSVAQGAMDDGLEDFYRVVQILKRNRDMVKSLLRGIKNMRPLDKFKFVEEDFKPKERPIKRRSEKKPLIINKHEVEKIAPVEKEPVTINDKEFINA